MYKKFNSYGEFIFDHQWANALTRAGRNYYPKLLTAIPFTPCEGDRILGRDHQSKLNLIDAGIKKMEAEEIESWHILFPNESGKSILRERNFVERYNYRFTWENENFIDFDNFLSIFTSRQRATIRKERKSIAKLGIEFKCKKYNEITDEDWNLFYVFYQKTYYERAQNPYLNKEKLQICTILGVLFKSTNTRLLTLVIGKLVENINGEWSEKRGSNPRPQPWQGCALPAELFSLLKLFGLILFYQKKDSQSFFDLWLTTLLKHITVHDLCT